MGRAAGAACAVLLGIAAFPAVARAQTDYRNLDDGRPVRTEDAFVVDHHEFEVLTPFTYDADVGGARRYTFQPELEYGIWPNTQLSIKVPIGIIDSAGKRRRRGRSPVLGDLQLQRRGADTACLLGACRPVPARPARSRATGRSSP